MTFKEKLRRLVSLSGRNRAEVATAAGLKPSLMSNYINRGSQPNAHAAMMLARHFEVSLDWLVDDQRSEWPAPSPVACHSVDALIEELGRRLIPIAAELKLKMEEASKKNWAQITEDLLRIGIDDPLPAGLKQAAELQFRINELMNLADSFSPHPPRDETGNVKDYELGLEVIQQSHRKLVSKLGWYSSWRISGFFLAPKEWRPPWQRDVIAHLHSLVVGDLLSATVEPPDREVVRSIIKRLMDLHPKQAKSWEKGLNVWESTQQAIDLWRASTTHETLIGSSKPRSPRKPKSIPGPS